MSDFSPVDVSRTHPGSKPPPTKSPRSEHPRCVDWVHFFRDTGSRNRTPNQTYTQRFSLRCVRRAMSERYHPMLRHSASTISSLRSRTSYPSAAKDVHRVFRDRRVTRPRPSFGRRQGFHPKQPHAERRCRENGKPNSYWDWADEASSDRPIWLA